jgi:Undecaprenyl-phosphate glucose phosphotransferase
MLDIRPRSLERFDYVCAPTEIGIPKVEGKRISPYNHVATTIFLDTVLIVVLGVGVNYAIAMARGTSAELQDWQIWAIFLAVVLQFIKAQACGAYHIERAFCLSGSVKRSVIAHAATFALIALFAVAAKQAEQYSRLWFFSWALASTASAVALRVILARRVLQKIEAGHHVSRAMAVSVGGKPIDPNEIERATERKARVIFAQHLNSLDGLLELGPTISAHHVDCLFISCPWEAAPATAATLAGLRHLSVKIFILPQEQGFWGIVDASLFGGDRLALCVSEETIEGWGLWMKRAEDLIIAAAALAFLAPLFLLVAVAIKLESRGPVFFRQTRVGFNGRQFKLWKFRSMYVEATDAHAAIQTSKDDRRVTRVGRLIRRLSIDELPQLFNVLDGTMSIVGPRPHALATKAENLHLEEAFDDYAARHRVKPGMTGLAQINGYRGELTSLEKLRRRIDFDLDYIKRWDIWLDLRIIAQTAGTVFWDRNAY